MHAFFPLFFSLEVRVQTSGDRASVHPDTHMDALGGEESKLTEDLEVKGGSARTRERRNESGLTANSLKKREQTSVSKLHVQVGTRPKTVVLIPKKTPKTFHFISLHFLSFSV